MLEITIDFYVRPNSAPRFSHPIQKEFVIDGKQINYTLPGTQDLEGNDEVTIHLSPTKGKKWLRPNFIFIDETNTTLTVRPDSNRTMIMRPSDWAN